MTITPLSSRAFNQDTECQESGNARPVYIADRGQTTYALLSLEECARLTDRQLGIPGVLAMPDGDVAHFDPPHLRGRLLHRRVGCVDMSARCVPINP